MLQAANTDLFNLLVPKVHNNECQNSVKMRLFNLQIKPAKVTLNLIWLIFRFFTFGTNGPSVVKTLLCLCFSGSMIIDNEQRVRQVRRAFFHVCVLSRLVPVMFCMLAGGSLQEGGLPTRGGSKNPIWPGFGTNVSLSLFVAPLGKKSPFSLPSLRWGGVEFENCLT